MAGLSFLYIFVVFHFFTIKIETGQILVLRTSIRMFKNGSGTPRKALDPVVSEKQNHKRLRRNERCD